MDFLEVTAVVRGRRGINSQSTCPSLLKELAFDLAAMISLKMHTRGSNTEKKINSTWALSLFQVHSFPRQDNSIPCYARLAKLAWKLTRGQSINFDMNHFDEILKY